MPISIISSRAPNKPQDSAAPARPKDVHFVLGVSGYFQKDLEAVKRCDTYNHLENNATPVTPGFDQVVQPGQVISILIVLQDGLVAIGDCVDVIFSGAASRDPVFHAEEHLPILETYVRDWVLGCDISSFRSNAQQADAHWPEISGKQLHTAIRYGLTQALLSATALFHRLTITQVVAMEWGTSTDKCCNLPVDILASCHRNDTLQLDRMIMKCVAMLPHASFVHCNDVGPRGIHLLEYVSFVARRVERCGRVGYHPRLHFDVYGTLGDVFPDDEALVRFLGRMHHAAQPYELLIESPVIASTKAKQLKRLRHLKQLLKERSIPVRLVADEWCNTLKDIQDFVDARAVDYVQIKMPDLGGIHNTIDAVLYCRQAGMECCLGGSANETDVSARISSHIALATRPNFMLSKPGMGADEGLMILTNEMLRTSALIRR